MVTSMSKSINYEFTQTDKIHWLENFASFLGNEKFSKDGFKFPLEVAEGFAKAGSTENGISHLLVNYTTKKDFNYSKKASDVFKLCIYFYQFKTDKHISIQANSKDIMGYDTDFDLIVVTGTTVDQKLTLPAGTKVKGITLVIDEAWVEDNLNESICSGKINELKNGAYFLKILTNKERVIIDDLINQDLNQLLLPRVHFNNRVLRLVEKTLQDICERGSTKDSLTNLNRRDFLNLISVEKLLINCYDSEFPSISSLAKSAFMSETKLKKMFKTSFGMGMYEYYQKNRMHMAKQLLREGKYSITEVGTKIGYQNLSNFSTAFKKEFNCLPKDFILAD